MKPCRDPHLLSPPVLSDLPRLKQTFPVPSSLCLLRLKGVLSCHSLSLKFCPQVPLCSPAAFQVMSSSLGLRESAKAFLKAQSGRSGLMEYCIYCTISCCSCWAGPSCAAWTSERGQNTQKGNTSWIKWDTVIARLWSVFYSPFETDFLSSTSPKLRFGKIRSYWSCWWFTFAQHLFYVPVKEGILKCPKRLRHLIKRLRSAKQKQTPEITCHRGKWRI